MTPTIAIIVPYCNRAAHLAKTLPVLLDYDPEARPWVIVVEQLRSTQGEHEMYPFNRGLLCNLGAVMANREQPELGFYCFHDVDMRPVDATYSCEGARPAALVGQIETRQGWKTTAPGYFGGVVVFTPEDLQIVGGFSNQYWGWGDEDIDLRMRVEMSEADLEIDSRESRFHHEEHPPNIVRHELIDNHNRLGKTQDGRIKSFEDGLATMPTLEPFKRNDVPGGTDGRPTLITHLQYAVDRPSIEAEYAQRTKVASETDAAATAATLKKLGIFPDQ